MQRSSYGERDYPFGQMMLTIRTTIGLTQTGLAHQLGVSRNAIAQWEGGSSYPKAEHLQRLIELGVRACAFPARHEAEAIQTLWRAARQKVLLDEHWLQGLLAPPASSPATGASEPLDGSWQEDRDASEEVALWTVPYLRNPHFTGRDDLLSYLEHELAPREPDQPRAIQWAALTRAQAIRGLGGVGKTQTAIEYAYRARAQGRYTHILWISAASEEAVLDSFAALTELVPALKRGAESDQYALVKQALRWLEQCQEPWLLIYDNADEISFLPAYLPRSDQGSILFTTRSSAIGGLAPSLEVDALPLEEGIHLLLRRAGRERAATLEDQEEARALVQALGSFPLAIDQAGAYLEETGCSLADYLQISELQQYHLLALRGKQASGYPASVATTWSLAFERVEQRNPAAAELLRLCAFVAPDHLPEELLVEGAAFWPPALREAVTDRLRFNQMLATLLDFSLIKRVGRERMLSLHRLVQVVQRERMTSEERRQWAERLLRAVHALFPADARAEVESWPRCQRLLEQAQICADWIKQEGFEQEEAIAVLLRLGIYLRERANYAQATVLLQQALHLQLQRDPGEGLPASEILLNLANLLAQQGKYIEAESLCRRGLRIRKQHLGETHLDVAFALHWLANIVDLQGRHADAQQVEERALRIYEQVLGPDHLLVAASLHNLAQTYYHQEKDVRQYEEIVLRALHIREQQLGPEHMRTVLVMEMLALVYKEQGKYEESEQLHLRILQVWTRQWGEEHPQLAHPLSDLADTYVSQGKDEQAEALFLRAIHLWDPEGKAEHPQLAYPFSGLAALYIRQGKDEQAETLFQQALRLCGQMGEPESLLAARILRRFAQLRQRQGRFVEEEALLQRALAIREQQLGSEHPRVLETRAALQVARLAQRRMPQEIHAEAHPQWLAAPPFIEPARVKQLLARHLGFSETEQE